MADDRSDGRVSLRIDRDVLLNVGGVLISIAVALITWKYSSATQPPVQADFAVVMGLVVGGIVFQLVVYSEVVKSKNRIGDVESSLSKKIGMDQKIYDRNDRLSRERARAIGMFYERPSGVEGVRRSHLARVLIGKHAECRIPVATESGRIEILTEIVGASREYVFACTFADYSYLREFWQMPSHEIHAYYQAQKSAIRRGVNVKRVFIKPTDIKVSAEDYRVQLDTILNAHSKEAAMDIGERVFIVTEAAAIAELTKSRIPFYSRSFFVSDGQFCSSGEAYYGTSNANEPKVHGSVNFFFQSDEPFKSHPTCDDFKRTFETLLLAQSRVAQ
jgi:hypothetical protein